MSKLMIAVILATAGSVAAAQGTYKYTDKDGRVIYTDNPNAGGGAAQPVENTTSTITLPASPGSTDASRKLLEQADRRDDALDKAFNDIVAAHAEIQAAQTRMQSGVEPLEGERQGRRFRPEYWQRQQALQGDLDRAQAKLDDALSRRNALK